MNWPRLESIIRRDPAGRGVASFQNAGAPLAAGHLEAAASELAAKARTVAIVTGFCIVDASPPAAETDGPPGGLYLARALEALGTEVILISDQFGCPLLELGCRLWGLDAVAVAEFPFEDGGPESEGRLQNTAEHCRRTDAWIDEFLASEPGSRLTHLVAIERAGPSHTRESLLAQRRSGLAPLAEFDREVPDESRDICHNMRGKPISGYTAKTHRLFEAVAARRPNVTTIGLADGGNELGMGALSWDLLRQAIAFGPAGRVACRIATDYLLIAGVSNWAAYALACAVAVLRGRADLIGAWDAATQRRLIESLVGDAGALDGVTRLRRATVDGLALDDYLQTLTEIGHAVGVIQATKSLFIPPV